MDSTVVRALPQQLCLRASPLLILTENHSYIQKIFSALLAKVKSSVGCITCSVHELKQEGAKGRNSKLLNLKSMHRSSFSAAQNLWLNIATLNKPLKS